MPKNAQGSWVGTQTQPIFPTYQTAGMLQPPPQSQPAPTTPPAVPPVTAPTDFMPPPINLGAGNYAPPLETTPGQGMIVPQVDSIGTEDQAHTRLVNAVLGATRGRNLAAKV